MKTKRALFFAALCVFVIGMTWCLTAEAAEWQCIQKSIICTLKRLKIKNGWIVEARHPPYGVALTFVPDINHEWVIR